MHSPHTKRNIARIIPFGMIWLIFSIVYTLLERALLGHLTYYPSTGNPYNFARNLFITPVLALITGLLIGIIEILYFYKLFIKMSFGGKILYKSLAYLALIISFLVVLTVIANSIELQTGLFNNRVWNNVWAFLSGFSFWGVSVYIASIIVVSQFYTEVSENLGQGVLHNFVSGKYHRPKEEERIFMFLDMKSSTTIAENLGHVKYFELLREYYVDLAEPIITYSGEIYQYVGDEIIVSWKLSKGLASNNCVQCFFAIKTVIKKQAKKYNARFGLLPAFKAGLHVGKVTTGEIGSIKKEIIFTGDVLNTTARLQGLCNAYESDLLISGQLVKRLTLLSQFQVIPLGEKELRGRDEKIEIFTLLPTADKK